MSDNSITQISTPGVTPLLITDLDSETASASVDFSVLGAASTPLAETGQSTSNAARLMIAMIFGLSVLVIIKIVTTSKLARFKAKLR